MSKGFSKLTLSAPISQNQSEFGIGMLKSEIETPKNENSKLKQDTCEKKILIKRLTETLNKEKAKQKCQTEI